MDDDSQSTTGMNIQDDRTLQETRTTLSAADVIAEAHLDPDSIFAGVQRFAQDRPRRLARQRSVLDELG